MSILFGKFKVHIQERPGTLMHRIFLTTHDQGGVVFIKSDGTVERFPEGVQVDESEAWFAEMTPDQLQAFAEALANKGIKTNKDSVAEGKLIATEKHLEDMRLIALHKYSPRGEVKD